MPNSIPPERIQTKRFLMRCWGPSDALLFKTALDFSLPELQKWIPWTKKEPSELSVLEERLRGYHEDFFGGRNALYAIMDLDEKEVLGGAALYRRIGPGAVEIGYWIRSDQAGRGLATEAARLLTKEGFELTDIGRIEMHCDEKNLASVAIPRKLGYQHRETVVEEPETPSEEPCRLMIWELSADEFREHLKGKRS